MTAKVAALLRESAEVLRRYGTPEPGCVLCGDHFGGPWLDLSHFRPANKRGQRTLVSLIRDLESAADAVERAEVER